MSTVVDFRHHLLDLQDDVFVNASLPLAFLQDGLVDKMMAHSKNDSSRIIRKISINKHVAFLVFQMVKHKAVPPRRATLH